MASRKKTAAAKAAAGNVADFMHSLQHPLKPEIQAVLKLVLDTDNDIADGIKWNSPSFFYREWFATLHLRNVDAVQIILHLGAKARPDVADIVIDDPADLLEWLGKDRATIKFKNGQEIRQNGPAFQSVISQWLAFLRVLHEQ